MISKVGRMSTMRMRCVCLRRLIQCTQMLDERNILQGAGTKLEEHVPYTGCIAILAPPEVMSGSTLGKLAVRPRAAQLVAAVHG